MCVCGCGGVCVCCRFKDKITKWKPRQYSLVRLQFAHLANRSYPLAHLWLKVRFGPGFFTPPPPLPIHFHFYHVLVLPATAEKKEI